MAKLLIFNFDGTNNEPEDAHQEVNKSGEVEDAGITNILKFHLMLGGNLKEKNTPLKNGSRSFYYNGVGTYGNFFQRMLNAGLALEKWDVAKIINTAMEDFDKFYDESIENVMVTGFSRGAAIARRFAALINNKVKDTCIIEGIFDTVASIGLPNLSSSDRPDCDVVFEDGCTLPGNVKTALHLVSLDDKRRAFQPTLMNKDKRVLEVWFPGAHSDVGGGYFYDGLSDSALRFFLDWFEDLDLGIPLLTSKTIDYPNILEDRLKYEIGPDDVQVDPDPLGKNHQQDRNIIASFATLTHRRCCVIENDRVQQDKVPLVHWSAAMRISKKRTYRPKSLENLTHQIIYPDFAQKQFTGIHEHKHKILQDYRVPDSENGIKTFVFAHKKYNHTRILLEAGNSYEIKVIDVERHKWNDGGVKDLDGEGWDRGDVELGLKEAPIAAMEPFRRVTADGGRWFSLCGCIEEDDASAFVIGNGVSEYTPKISGELCAFANDLDGYYGNNTGKLKIQVKKC